MKIATGDTDSGLKLLAQAAGRPQSIERFPSDSENVKAEQQNPCKKSKPALVQPRARRSDPAPMKLNYAPEPTLASLHVPEPPMVHSAAMPEIPYITAEQREILRAQQSEIHRMQRVHEQEAKRIMREVSLKYGPGHLPNAEEIRIQVQEKLNSWAQ
jgi:hypothetical protein